MIRAGGSLLLITIISLLLNNHADAAPFRICNLFALFSRPERVNANRPPAATGGIDRRNLFIGSVDDAEFINARAAIDASYSKEARDYLRAARDRLEVNRDVGMAVTVPDLKTIGDKIQIGDESFEVLAVLGAGRSGTVYRVQGPDGIYVIKKVHRLEELELEIKAYDYLRQLGLPAPRLIRTVQDTGELLLSHIDAIPIDRIFDLHRRGEKFPPGLIAGLRIRLAVFEERFADSEIAMKNLGIDLDSGEIVVLDKD